jgi:aryl-alcohol dehydrogenase-like predicted oxidoreductase
MEYRNVGSSGLKVSALGLGTNNFGGRLDEAASKAVVNAAFELGVTHFDTADIYSNGASEEILGRALQGRRDQAVVATKLGGDAPWGRGGSRRYLVRAVEGTLRRLGTDRIDLLYLHKPDPDTPLDETLAAFDALIAAGKVLYIASSNFAAWSLVRSQHLSHELGLARFVATQEGYSLLNRKVEQEVVPAAKAYGVGLIPYFPLESGVLTGKYRPGQAMPDGTRLTRSPQMAARFATEANLARAEALRGIAEAAGAELIDLAFGWLLRDPVVPSVIAGASTPEQLVRNARAAAWVPPPDVVAAVG